MKQIIILILTAIITTSIFFGTSCNSSDCCANCDSMQVILDEYIQRDSMKSSLLKCYDSHLSQFGDIQDSIEHFQMSIDSLKSVIKQKGRASGSQSKELQSYISKIRNLIAKNEELANELKNSGFQNASLDKLIQLMYSSIESKQAELKQTQKELADLKVKVKGLESQVDSLTGENTTLISTIEDLNTKVSKISGSVKIIQPKERKAKKIQSLNIKYTLKENHDAPTGKVTLYFRIHDQQGAILENPEGEFYYGGRNIAYTVKSEADFTGKELKGNVTWNKTTQNLQAGTYTVVMYINDTKEAEDTFVMEK